MVAAQRIYDLRLKIMSDSESKTDYKDLFDDDQPSTFGAFAKTSTKTEVIPRESKYEKITTLLALQRRTYMYGDTSGRSTSGC